MDARDRSDDGAPLRGADGREQASGADEEASGSARTAAGERGAQQASASGRRGGERARRRGARGRAQALGFWAWRSEGGLLCLNTVAPRATALVVKRSGTTSGTGASSA